MLLLRAVCHGCLQGLETKQAFALASAFLVLTDGVPPALLCLWGPLQQAAVLQSDLQTEALSLAGRTCTAIAQTLNITTKPLGSSPGPEQAAAAGAAQPRTVDRLRSTSARPAHIVAALDNLTTLMQLGSPYAAHIQEGRKGGNMGHVCLDAGDVVCSCGGQGQACCVHASSPRHLRLLHAASGAGSVGLLLTLPFAAAAPQP